MSHVSHVSGDPGGHRVGTVAKWGQKCYIWDTFSQKETNMNFIVIRRPDDPVDEACHAYKRVFPDLEKAKEFAERVAIREQEDLGGTIISSPYEVVLSGSEVGRKSVRWLIDELITNASERHCPHCGGPVTDSEIGDYRWQCPECEEDFYDFECAPSEEK